MISVMSLFNGAQHKVALKIAKLILSSDEQSGEECENDFDGSLDQLAYLTKFIDN